jgi:uncharacterized protein
MSEVDLLAPPDEEAIDSAVKAYSAALARQYGDRLRGIYLFGSRARGDFNPYSDVDVAIVLRDPLEPKSPMRALSGLAYDVFLQTGAEIQPWVFREAEWNEPEGSPSARLIRSVRRDGKKVQFQ